MTLCKNKRTARVYGLVAGIVPVTVMLALLLGCESASSKPVKATPAVTNSAGPGIDLNCVVSHIQSPTESFHYSFRAVSDNPWQEDAEVTPQNIDGSFMNNSLPNPQQFHGPPQQVWSNLMAIGRMASIFSTIHSTAAVINQGSERKNGYDTVKYSIDTTRGNSTEQALFNNVFGPGGFEKGSVWVTSQGCPVQIALDQEIHQKDGSPAGKAHYEEAMIKKQ